MALITVETDKLRKIWKAPQIHSVVTVPPVGLVCLSGQVACFTDDPSGNTCAPNCGECPSLTC